MQSVNDDSPGDQPGDVNEREQGNASTSYRRQQIGFFAIVSSDIFGNPKIVEAGPHGTLVFFHALCRNAACGRTGFLDASNFAPNYLARQIGITRDEAATAFESCLRVGLLSRDVDTREVRICGWGDEWRRGAMSEAERVRKADYRKRQKENEIEKEKEKEIESKTGHVPDKSGHVPDKKGRQAREARRTRKVPLPDGWEPSNAAFLEACKLGLDFEHEAKQFRLHHKAKGSLFVDWDAAFRTWLGNARRFAPRERNSPTQTALELLREAEERERRGILAVDPFGDDVPHAAEVA